MAVEPLIAVITSDVAVVESWSTFKDRVGAVLALGYVASVRGNEAVLAELVANVTADP